jgi:hypothetical protein
MVMLEKTKVSEMKNFGTVVREIARAVEIVQICLTQLSE